MKQCEQCGHTTDDYLMVYPKCGGRLNQTDNPENVSIEKRQMTVNEAIFSIEQKMTFFYRSKEMCIAQGIVELRYRSEWT